jgi:hypothetical protein
VVSLIEGIKLSASVRPHFHKDTQFVCGDPNQKVGSHDHASALLSDKNQLIHLQGDTMMTHQ